ncbi:hypothetical protein DRE_04757 [Drechslerella stenobrocha 248]|uniref:Uncharacterized protein n=1 Tax=Drechslerella stenobrocha 248 TaxID=1043628 RepID=W7HS26_9PEZI|nr:hypothetical protein DRE_04757 [Drechslerella stenobrocha 248]
MLSRRLLVRPFPRRSPSSAVNIQRRYTSHFDGPSANARTEFKPDFTTQETVPNWVYIASGTIFAAYVLYGYIMPTETTWLTQFLSPDSETRKAQEEISNRHTAFIEQAARDKHLFLQSPTSRTLPMRFPERFNMHSPLNHDVGHTRGILMDQLEEHYRKENPPK